MEVRLKSFESQVQRRPQGLERALSYITHHDTSNSSDSFTRPSSLLHPIDLSVILWTSLLLLACHKLYICMLLYHAYLYIGFSSKKVFRKNCRSGTSNSSSSFTRPSSSLLHPIDLSLILWSSSVVICLPQIVYT